MKRHTRRAVIVALTLVACSASTGFGADTTDPLLDLMLKKGLITQAEAAKVKAEAESMQTNMAAMPPLESKWKIDKAVKSMGLFGDVRLRYERRSAEDPSGGSIDLNRLRYSVRVGVRGSLFDDFYFGFRIDPSGNPRSAWLTLGTSASGNPYQGPFGKSTAGLNIGQAYLGWHGLDWLDITAGKMPNPLYVSSMVWDSDLAPEGLSERLHYAVGEADFFANFGQFLYQDTNPTGTPKGYFNLGYTSSSPAFMLAWQAGVNYHLHKKVALKVAPVLYNYTGRGVNTTVGNTDRPGFSGTFIGQGSTNGITGSPAYWNGYPSGPYDGFAANQTGINDLLVLEVPWELNFQFDKISARLFGDYAQNLNGADRARAAYLAQQDPLLAGSGLAMIPSAQTHDNKAYQIGVAFGSTNALGLVSGANARKHAWEFRTYWQHVEQYALDPNLLDSDFFEGRANLEGVYAAVAYGLTDNLIATLRYGYAQRINNKLGTGGSNLDIPQMNPINRYNLFQMDLTLKF